MPGEDKTTEETSTTDLNQSVVRNVSINVLSTNVQETNSSRNKHLLTSTSLNNSDQIEDLIHDLTITTVSSTSNFTLCSETVNPTVDFRK